MKLRKMNYKQNGETRQGEKWYAVWMDHSETLRRLPLFADQKASNEIARKIDRLNSVRASGDTLPPDLSRYVEQMPRAMRTRLAEWGILSAAKAAAGKPLVEHVADWKAALLARGGTKQHAALSASRVRRIIEGCGFAFHGDVSPSKTQRFLADLREERRKEDGQMHQGISAASFNYYLRDAKSFFKWMVRDGRANENPLEHLQGVNVRLDRRHDRRALSLEELRQLLDITGNAAERFGMTGESRAALYRLAAETGLRAGELRSLTRGSFVLDGLKPGVTIAAAYAKNRRQDNLPLRPTTAAAMADYLSSKLPAAKAFSMPARGHLVDMFRADLAEAREAWIGKAKDAEARQERESSNFLVYRDDANRVADFHALRHTFISNLAAAGVHPKTAQTLARHSTITLTMDRYSHVYRGELTTALDSLPDLSHPGTDKAKATGTDNVSVASENCLSPDLSPKGKFPRSLVESGGLKSAMPGSDETHGKTGMKCDFPEGKSKRPRSDSNRRITDLQSVPLVHLGTRPGL